MVRASSDALARWQTLHALQFDGIGPARGELGHVKTAFGIDSQIVGVLKELLAVGHGAELGRSCLAQRYSAPQAAGPTEAAGRRPRRKLPGTT